MGEFPSYKLDYIDENIDITNTHLAIIITLLTEIRDALKEKHPTVSLPSNPQEEETQRGSVSTEGASWAMEGAT